MSKRTSNWTKISGKNALDRRERRHGFAANSRCSLLIFCDDFTVLQYRQQRSLKGKSLPEKAKMASGRSVFGLSYWKTVISLHA
jgi:hypothetical protein